MPAISRRELFLLGACAAPWTRAFGWQAAPDFSTGVRVVNVLATVRDKDGQIVTDLTQDDFVIEERGHPQTIRYFARQTGLPLTLGLLVDVSGSQRNVLEPQRDASFQFFHQILREGADWAFVLAFDKEIDLIQDLTSSLAELDTGLQKLVLNRDPYGKLPEHAQGTALYNAVFAAAQKIMSRQHGRKALIVFSDGVDTNSSKSLSAAIDECQREDTLVYTIRFYDQRLTEFALPPGTLGPQQQLRDGKKVLVRMTNRTGGGYFELPDAEGLDKIYASIEEELRNQYSLGYSPPKGKPGYRKISVSVKRKGLTVQARDGYFSAA
jgi:VWFA-related protein